MAITIRSLAEGLPKPVTTEDCTPLDEAVTIMLEHGYSQLPVMHDDEVVGMVSTDSVAQALLHMKVGLAGLKVLDARTDFETVGIEDDLFSVLDKILKTAAVFVMDEDKKLCSVMTAYDTTQYLRLRSEDIILVEDVETTLKDYLRYACGCQGDNDSDLLTRMVVHVGHKPTQQRQKLKQKLLQFQTTNPPALFSTLIDQIVDHVHPVESNPKLPHFDGLNLGQYLNIAEQREVWPQIEALFGVNKNTFHQLTDPVRATRNELAHFRGDIKPIDRNRLRYCANWFELHPIPLPPDAVGAVEENSSPLDIVSLSQKTQVYALEGEDSGGSTDVSDDPFKGKYAPLGRFLKDQLPAGKPIALSFDDIEKIIATKLPETARAHRSWWANDSVGHVQSKQWLAANWRVSYVNIPEGKVAFDHMGKEEQAAIGFLTDVREVLDRKDFFSLRDSVSRNAFETVLVRRSLCNKGSAELSLTFTGDQIGRLKWFITTHNPDLNAMIYTRLEALLRTSAPPYRQRGRVERVERGDELKALRVLVDTPSAQEKGIENVAEFIGGFYSLLVPFIQEVTDLDKEVSTK